MNDGLLRVWSIPMAIIATALAGSGCAWYRHAFVSLPTTAADLRAIDPLDLRGSAVSPAQSEVPPGIPAAPRPAPPAELSLTLAECRAAALANNLQIRATLIEPAIANARVREEEARFEAVFTADVSYATTDTPVSTTLQGSRAHRFAIETGVEMPLRTGGTLRFDLADRRTRTNNPFSTLNPAYETDAGFSFSQPLLRQAGRRANTHAIRLALYQRHVALAATRLEIIRVLAAVDRVYWRLYASRGVLEVRRQDYALAEAQWQTAQRLVASGERPQIDVVRAEAALASRLEGIITAENALRERERELKRVLNRDDVPMASPTVLIPVSGPDTTHYTLDAGKLVAQAQHLRMELLELELRLAQDDSTVEYLRNQLLPLVTLGYAYNINGLGDTRWDAYDLLESRRFADHVAGVRLLVPIGNQAAESRLRQALLARRQRLNSRADREAMVEQEVLATCDTVEAAWQRVLANRQSAVLAARLLEAEKRQYDLGLNTSNDVLDAQGRLAGAQSAEVQALAEYQIALVDLAYATGTLLGAARIEWEEDARSDP